MYMRQPLLSGGVSPLTRFMACRAWTLEQQGRTCVGLVPSWLQLALPCKSWASQAATSTARASRSKAGDHPHVA